MDAAPTDREESPAEQARTGLAHEDPLSRERIVRVALALVDREGLNALSMRRLGAELGVVPMAIYYYIPNKDALQDAIVEAVIGEIDFTMDDASASPEDRILCAAKAYRDALLAHLRAVPLVFSRQLTTRTAMKPMEFLIGILRDAGLGPIEAFAGMNAIAASVRGAVSMVVHGRHEPPGAQALAEFDERFPPEQFPNLHATVFSAPTSFEQAFEFGIRALARGLLATEPRQESIKDPRRDK